MIRDYTTKYSDPTNFKINLIVYTKQYTNFHTRIDFLE